MGKEDIIHHIDCLLAEILPGIIPEPKFWRPLVQFENLVELTEISKALEQSPEIQKKLKKYLEISAKKLVKQVQDFLDRGNLSGIAKLDVILPEEYADVLAHMLFDFAKIGYESLPVQTRGVFPEKLIKIWTIETASLWTQKAALQLKSQVVGFALDTYLKSLSLERGNL